MKVHTKQMCVTKFLHAEKVAPIDIQRRLLNVDGDQTVDCDVGDRLPSGAALHSCQPRNEERFGQLISANRRITNSKLCTGLNVGFSAL
jgi:hypothetical protein